jgi:hypothetical protein
MWRRDFEYLRAVAKVEDPPDPVNSTFLGGDVDFAPGEPEGGAFVAAGGFDLQ